jgi:hypothetical protein
MTKRMAQSLKQLLAKRRCRFRQVDEVARKASRCATRTRNVRAPVIPSYAILL